MKVWQRLLNKTACALRVFGDEAVTDIADFVCSQLTAEGGFRGKTGDADLYYSVFGTACLRVLRRPLAAPTLTSYLEGFGTGDGLDLVHLSCLARCHGQLPGGGVRVRDGILGRVASFRAGDGGYAFETRAAGSEVYAGFLACLAYESLGVALPDGAALVDSVSNARTGDGFYGREGAAGSVPVTAAAVVLLEDNGAQVGDKAGAWLVAQARSGGGFGAGPEAPGADLLSTATALYALCCLGKTCAAAAARHASFVEGLWDGSGGFRGHPLGGSPDCEHTFYGLLASGCLADTMAGGGGRDGDGGGASRS